MRQDELSARLLVTFLGELDERLREMNVALLALEEDPASEEQLKPLLRVAHTLKGAARAVHVSPIEQVCHGLEALLANAREGRIGLSRSHFDLLFAAADALTDAGSRLREGRSLADAPLASVLESLTRATPGPEIAEAESPPGLAPPAAASRIDGYVRVPSGRLDTLLATAGDILVGSRRALALAGELAERADLAARVQDRWRVASRRIRLELARTSGRPGNVEALTRVEDDLRRLTQDLGQLARSEIEDARTLSRSADELLYQLRRLRMRPFLEACEALPRTVRDLAGVTGKKVDLEVTGADVVADREVLDGLRDALLQLVRNAVDHGIEPPEEREESGKTPRGRIRVSAVLNGDRIAVTVADDGRGLDVPAIRRELERRGAAEPGDDAALVNSLIEGGLSTRGVVTPISGRGVGLDVVRTAVARIRGTIRVSWAPGRGTAFVMECPPTLIRVGALLVGVGSQVAALPTAHIERLLLVRRGEVRRVEARTVITTSEGPVPTVALARLLPPLVAAPAAEPLPLVLLRSAEHRLGVAVDELLGVQDLVLQPLEHTGEARLPHVTGAALLPTGQIALVLNPVTLVEAGLAGDESVDVAPAELRPGPRATRRILVVDDSITTRTLEQSILEAAGYEVLTAVDGQDGWQAVQERGCDLIVADVAMPRMDGFGLCETVRASKRFRDLPIVLVTAMETPEHRSRGLEVGADAYIGKSSFDQRNLLETIRQLLG